MKVKRENLLAYCLSSIFFLLILVFYYNYGEWTLGALPQICYQDYCVSDWLINYEGGFVRRGLLGQLLFWSYSVWPFNVREFVLLLPFFLSPLLLFLMLRLFYRQQWPPTVIFCVCCMGGTAFLSPLIRRDYLVLILIYALFYLVSQWLRTNRKSYFLAYFLVSSVLILSYEPSVFVVFPIVFLVAGKRLLTWTVLPVILVTFLSKGTADIGQSIWQSWTPLFETYPGCDESGIIGFGEDALGWDIWPTFIFHLHSAYIGPEPSWTSGPLIIYMLAGTYYLVTFLDVAKVPFWPNARTASFDTHAMSNAFLLQFLAMLPMFTVLSCDWGRTIPLCTISVLFVVYFFPEAASRVSFIDKASGLFLSALGRCPILRSPLFYYFVAVTIPMPLVLAPKIKDSIIGLVFQALNNHM